MKHLLLLLLFASAPQLYAQGFALPLTLQRGTGLLGIESITHLGLFRGNSNSTFKKTRSDGNREKYFEQGVTFSFAYALHQRFTLKIDVPLVYRNEHNFYNVSNWGLGDTHASALVHLIQNNSGWALHLSYEHIFPSGSSSIKWSPSQGIQTLPLGYGVTRIQPSVLVSYTKASTLQYLQLIYQTSFEETASYLIAAPNVPQTDSMGTNYLTPPGNLRIDFGDRYTVKIGHSLEISSKIKFNLDAAYTYGRPATITNFVYGQNADLTLAISKSSAETSTMQMARANLGLEETLNSQWTLYQWVGSEFYARNAPNLETGLVESYLGPSFRLGAVYAF